MNTDEIILESTKEANKIEKHIDIINYKQKVDEAFVLSNVIKLSDNKLTILKGTTTTALKPINIELLENLKVNLLEWNNNDVVSLILEIVKKISVNDLNDLYNWTNNFLNAISKNEILNIEVYIKDENVEKIKVKNLYKAVENFFSLFDIISLANFDEEKGSIIKKFKFILKKTYNNINDVLINIHNYLEDSSTLNNKSPEKEFLELFDAMIECGESSIKIQNKYLIVNDGRMVYLKEIQKNKIIIQKKIVIDGANNV